LYINRFQIKKVVAFNETNLLILVNVFLVYVLHLSCNFLTYLIKILKRSFVFVPILCFVVFVIYVCALKSQLVNRCAENIAFPTFYEKHLYCSVVNF